jgi:hypothetical protein
MSALPIEQTNPSRFVDTPRAALKTVGLGQGTYGADA